MAAQLAVLHSRPRGQFEDERDLVREQHEHIEATERGDIRLLPRSDGDAEGENDEGEPE